MSEKTKTAAGYARQHLGWAANDLKDAEAFAKKAGDAALAKEIRGHIEKVKATRDKLSAKLE